MLLPHSTVFELIQNLLDDVIIFKVAKFGGEQLLGILVDGVLGDDVLNIIFGHLPFVLVDYCT